MSNEYRVPEPVTKYKHSDKPTNIPDYPSGAQVGKLRECAVLGCTSCQQSLEALASYVENEAITNGEHTDITTYK